MRRLPAILACAALAAGPALACPGCSDAAGSQNPDYARGVFYGILLFLSLPALLVGGIALAIRRARRRADREGGVAIGQSPDPPR